MNIQPVVEGHAEVEAVPVLLRRLRDEAGLYALDINRPLRRHRSELAQETLLRQSILLARAQKNCGAILVLLDSDDNCPRDLGAVLQAAAQVEAAPFPCAVVLAHREYEAWLLAAVESLRGLRGILPDADSPPEPEAPRDCKGQLARRMPCGQRYIPRVDQPALTAAFDLVSAYRRCRSFRRLVRAFGLLAAGMDLKLPPWPPPTWLEKS